MTSFEEFPTFEFQNLLENDDFIPEWSVSDEELIRLADISERQSETAKKQSRFVKLSDKDLTDIVSSAEANGTKRNTKWIINTIEGKFCSWNY